MLLSLHNIEHGLVCKAISFLNARDLVSVASTSAWLRAAVVGEAGVASASVTATIQRHCFLSRWKPSTNPELKTLSDIEFALLHQERIAGRYEIQTDEGSGLDCTLDISPTGRFMNYSAL